jgi:hypothetical protein
LRIPVVISSGYGALDVGARFSGHLPNFLIIAARRTA